MWRVCSDFDGERLAARFASDAGPRKDGNRTDFADSRNPRRGKLRWRTRPIEAKLAREERERMRSKTRSIGMPVVVAILRSIAGQFDFRAVIRATSQEIQDLLPHNHLDVALMNADQTMVIAYETGTPHRMGRRYDRVGGGGHQSDPRPLSRQDRPYRH